MRFPHYQQLEQKDCGATCLKIVAKFHGKVIDLQYLRDLCGSSREGVSILNISQAAETIGFRSLVLEVNFEQLLKKISYPCIVHWNQRHFVVVYKVTKKRVWISDPAKNKISYSISDFLRQWSAGNDNGFVMVLEPQPFFDKLEIEEKAGRNTYFQLAFSYFGGYKKELFQLGLILLILTTLQSILPFIFRAIIDVGVSRNDYDFINIILFANIVLIVSIAIGNFIREWMVSQIGARFSIALISDYIIKLLKMPLQYFETRMIGDTLNKVKDHEIIKNFLLNHSLNLFLALLSFSVFSVVLLSFDVYLFLIFLIGTSIYILWALFFVRFHEKFDWEQNHLSIQNQGFWIETLSTISEIKVNNYELKKRWKWEKIQASMYRSNQKALHLHHFQNIGSQLINGLKNVFLTFYSAKAVMSGDMSLGTMISLQFIIGFLNTPIQQFIAFIQSFPGARISFMRLNDIHRYADEELNKNAGNFSIQLKKDIQIRNLYFRYSEADPYTLKNISLTIPAGKVTAIVGMSGSGKSTLLKLLLRLYPPTEGDIFIGTTNMNDIYLHKWRSHCAAVLQEGKIFNDTILNNITLGDNDINYDRVGQVVQVSQLKEVVDNLAMGYNTRIGEKGRSLSPGQKQRLLIARALYRNPDYLFLDEATNSLDSINEYRVLNSLGIVLKGKTVIVAAHRLSTIKNADQIVVMDNGKIIEIGTHDELIQKNSFYNRLVMNQVSQSL